MRQVGNMKQIFEFIDIPGCSHTLSLCMKCGQVVGNQMQHAAWHENMQSYKEYFNKVANKMGLDPLHEVKDDKSTG